MRDCLFGLRGAYNPGVLFGRFWRYPAYLSGL